jgi:hypothetical protein
MVVANHIYFKIIIIIIIHSFLPISYNNSLDFKKNFMKQQEKREGYGMK